ncbi:MAG: FkbM family methyltransferase [Nanoarchaeota archaeon]|nr:FkbM family methyltransferase [Nanoarchaeota archaeon]
MKVIQKLLKGIFKAESKEVLAAQSMSSEVKSTEIQGQNSVAAMDEALERAAKLGLNINTVIDIGASDGGWSEIVLKHFPTARYFLIEAQKGHKKGLRKRSKEKDFEYIISAAGDYEGQVYFDATDLWAGQASKKKLDIKNCIRVPVTTVDIQVKKKQLKGPFLIKTDTHGFEIPILNGAKKSLKNTELLIIEAYNFKIGDCCLRFHEMISFLEEKGFRCIDIVDINRRPIDNILFQMEMFFIKKNRKEFNYRCYDDFWMKKNEQE